MRLQASTQCCSDHHDRPSRPGRERCRQRTSDSSPRRDRHLRERHDTRTSPGRRAAPKQRNPSHRNRGTPRAQPGDGARNGCADPGVRGTRRPTGVGRAVRRHPLYDRRGERRRTRRTRLRGERSGNLRGAPRLIRSRDEHTSSAPCHAVPTAASSPRLPINPYSGLRRSAREAPAGLPRSEGSDSRSASTTLSRRAIRSRATSAATARRFRSSPPFHRPPAVAGRLTAPRVVTYSLFRCRSRARLPHSANVRGRTFAPLGLLLLQKAV